MEKNLPKITQQQLVDWIAALRSGNYLQGKGYLKQRTLEGDIKYCCLGVLQELFGEFCSSSVRRKSFGNEDEVEVYQTVNLGYKGIPEILLSPVVVFNAPPDALGETPCEFFTVNWLQALNDDGYTFEQIADVLEQADFKEPL